MKPSRDLIEKIAQEEAESAGANLTDVIHMRLTPEAMRGRVMAWKRIIEETGCRPSKLATAWGCSREAIYEAFSRIARVPDPVSPYDAASRAKLLWQHPDCAADIIAGTDAETNADIAAWRNLGSQTRKASA